MSIVAEDKCLKVDDMTEVALGDATKAWTSSTDATCADMAGTDCRCTDRVKVARGDTNVASTKRCEKFKVCVPSGKCVCDWGTTTFKPL